MTTINKESTPPKSFETNAKMGLTEEDHGTTTNVFPKESYFQNQHLIQNKTSQG